MPSDRPSSLVDSASGAVADGADPPPAEVMAAVRESVIVLADAMPAFSGACYDQLIALVPTVLQTSQDHGYGLADGLTRQLVRAAVDSDRPGPVAERLRRAGAQLYRDGLPADGYQAAAHAVLRGARDSYPHDWESTLSSAWVAYLGWAVDHLARGAESARRSGVHLPEVPLSAAAAAAPRSLSEILAFLRTGPFEGNPKALDSVVTRVALRTGVDLRFPRMDQQGDPALVDTVLSNLGRMGYSVGAVNVVDGDPADPAAVPAARVVAEGERPRRARWWNRRARATGSPAPVPVAIRAAAAPVAAPVGGPPGTPASGLRGRFDAFSGLGPAQPAPVPERPPRTLTDVLASLRTGVFAGNEWALEGVLTRVALRTGADIRSPRPDQVADPTVVQEVLAVLSRMGYGETAAATTARPRWWARQRRHEASA